MSQHPRWTLALKAEDMYDSVQSYLKSEWRESHPKTLKQSEQDQCPTLSWPLSSQQSTKTLEKTAICRRSLEAVALYIFLPTASTKSFSLNWTEPWTPHDPEVYLTVLNSGAICKMQRARDCGSSASLMAEYKRQQDWEFSELTRTNKWYVRAVTKLCTHQACQLLLCWFSDTTQNISWSWSGGIPGEKCPGKSHCKVLLMWAKIKITRDLCVLGVLGCWECSAGHPGISCGLGFLAHPH